MGLKEVAKKNVGSGSSETYFPTFSKAAKSGGRVIAQGATAAGAALGTQVSSLKTLSFFLLGMGLIHFAFLRGQGTIHLISSIALLFVGGMVFFNYLKDSGAIQKTLGGWAVIIAFLIWYLGFGSSERSLPYVGIGLGIALAIYGVSTKGAGLKEAMAGLVPILFFFIDMGLIGWLFGKFNWSLTPLIENLINWMPWWSLLGLICLKTESVVLNIVKVGGILYVILILVVPYIPELGHQKAAGLLPTTEEMQKAEKSLKEGLVEKANPAYIKFQCLMELTAMSSGQTTTSMEECIRKRNEEYEIKKICEKRMIEAGLKAGGADYKICVEEETNKRKKMAGVAAMGKDDPTLLATTAEFKISSQFPKTIYQPKWTFPVQLEIKNPKEQKIDAEISCWFERGSKNVTGRVDKPKIKITTSKEEGIKCTPEEDLAKGNYNLVFLANFYNLSTTSRLDLLFVGGMTEEQRYEEWVRGLKETYLRGKDYSRGPKDFARISFGIGMYPLIKKGDNPNFASQIENLGKGKIIAVRRYYGDLESRGIMPSEAGCFSGENFALPQFKTKYRETIPLTVCSVDLSTFEMLEGDEFKVEEVAMTLEYDYQIKKEDIKITVELPEATTTS